MPRVAEPVQSDHTQRESNQHEVLLTHRLNDYLPSLAQFHSMRTLKQSLLYRSLEKQIESTLNTIEYGCYAPKLPYERKPFYRTVAWNIERGKNFAGILELLKTHPLLSRADCLYLTETDIGMARTQNLNIARELARHLHMNYFFVPSYLNLCKGNNVEGHFAGDNELGLHGNALLTRYPIEGMRFVSLKNCKDKMRGKEKRLGSQRALIAEIVFPFRKLTAIVAHLDAHSSQRQRAQQLDTILEHVKQTRHPMLLGGDLNTSTYNAARAIYAFFGFWNKVFRGVDDVIDNHYPYPYRYYERSLFEVMKKFELDFESFNELGVGTLHYHVEDIQGNQLILEVVPEWCRKIMENTLRRHGGKVSLRLDWFAGKWLKPVNGVAGAIAPKVIPDLRYGGMRVSDHDPIMVDVDLYAT